MTVLESPQSQRTQSKENSNNAQVIEADPILCPHCKRTASNGIKCKGICVSDSDY